MSKFTIFTIILSVSVITVMADLVVRDYFNDTGSSADALTSVISADPETPTGAPVRSVAPVSRTRDISEESSSTTTPAVQTPSQPAPVVIPTITEAKVRQAGFTGDFSEKHFDGKVFQLLDITKNPVDGIAFFEVSQDIGTVASITEITLRDEIRALQLYSLLQNKTKTYIDLSLNETNAYGDHSFYINHAKKPQEAFLTVKIGKMIYCFAYVKFYHPEIKKLIQILSL